MKTWLSEVASPVDGSLGEKEDGTDRRLRLFDLLLALALCLLVALPLVALRRYLASVSVHGRYGSPFKLHYLALPSGICGRVLTALGARHWPTLVNVLIGDMAFVGPRPRESTESQEPQPYAVRPGLVSPWLIRQRTGADFVCEGEVDRQYQSRRGFRHDLGILLRVPFATLLPRRPVHVPSKVEVGNVEVDNLSMRDAVERIAQMLDEKASHHVCFVNAACVNEAAANSTYRDSVRKASLVLPDGIGMRISSHLLGTPLRQNVNGTDLFPRLVEAIHSKRPKVYLLGGRPSVAAAAAAEIVRIWPGVRVVGHHHGYFAPVDTPTVVRAVRVCDPDLLLVGLGVPMQDIFINHHLCELNARAAIGVGGLFDFISGSIERAPVWMRETGLEWVWRLALEPRRLWRRYLVGNVAFLARVLTQRARLAQRRSSIDVPAPYRPDSRRSLPVQRRARVNHRTYGG